MLGLFIKLESNVLMRRLYIRVSMVIVTDLFLLSLRDCLSTFGIGRGHLVPAVSVSNMN